MKNQSVHKSAQKLASDIPPKRPPNQQPLASRQPTYPVFEAAIIAVSLSFAAHPAEGLGRQNVLLKRAFFENVCITCFKTQATAPQEWPGYEDQLPHPRH